MKGSAQEYSIFNLLCEKYYSINTILRFIFYIPILFLSCSPSEDDDLDMNVKESIVDIYFNNKTGSIVPIWNGINAGYLTQNLSENIPDLNDLYSNGFRYLRFQETLHRVYTEDDENGNPVYNWEYFNRVLDKAVNTEFKLLFVLESTLDPIAENPPKPGYEWCKRYPSADYNKWYRLIQDVVRHCQERYGGNTIKS